MDNKHDAVYRMIHLGKLFASCNCYDLSVIPSAVELLSIVKVSKIFPGDNFISYNILILLFFYKKSIVTESAQICINCLRSQNSQKIIKRKSMIRNSYHTPIKCAVKKK